MPRERWPDFAKGIAIVLVVYGHAVRGLEGAKLISYDDGWGLADYFIYTVHMPVFFFISGYFFDASIRKGTSLFWRSRAGTIIWPYFLWTALQFGAQFLGDRLGLTNGSLEPDRILSILWNPISPFWFLYALAAALAISALMQTVSPVVVAVISGAALVALSVVAHPTVLNDIVYALLYVSLGRWLKSLDFNFSGKGIEVYLFLVSVFLISASAGYIFLIPDRLNFIAGIAGVVLFCCISQLASRQGTVSKFISTLGVYSMGIYVMHITALGIGRAVGLRIFDGSIPLTITLQLLMGIGLPVLVQLVANKVDIAKYLGLETPATKSAMKIDRNAGNPEIASRVSNTHSVLVRDGK